MADESKEYLPTLKSTFYITMAGAALFVAVVFLFIL